MSPTPSSCGPGLPHVLLCSPDHRCPGSAWGALREEPLSQSRRPGGWSVTAQVPPQGTQLGLLPSGPPAMRPLLLGD